MNRAPLVVLVGQQDRRHLAFEPFLAGKLERLAGDYPVSVEQPVRPQEVPGAIERAYHAAATHRGPALVIVPMDDWSAPAEDDREDAAAGQVLRATSVDPAAVDALASFLADAESPAFVVGAGADDAETWAALVALAERLRVPVFQESFGARAGFPQDHPLFAGFLPADRPRLREKLAPYDALLVVGAPVFRQSPYAPGRFTDAGTRIAVVGDNADELHRSPADLARARAAGRGLPGARRARRRRGTLRLPSRFVRRPRPSRASRCARGTSSRRSRTACRATPSSSRRRRSTGPSSTTACSRASRSASSARRWAGSASRSAARPASGWRCRSARSSRSSATARPSTASRRLWSAAHYRVGVLFVILSNGGYAIMDRLAERVEREPPWPSFDVDVAALARAFGCPARRITTHDELVRELDEIVPTLASRDEPVLLDVVDRADGDVRAVRLRSRAFRPEQSSSAGVATWRCTHGERRPTVAAAGTTSVRDDRHGADRLRLPVAVFRSCGDRSQPSRTTPTCTLASRGRRLGNRLDADMPLAIDATLRYGLGVPGTRPLTKADLASRTPYNTRRYKGLPPTPIGNPGLRVDPGRRASGEGRLPLLRAEAGQAAPLLHGDADEFCRKAREYGYGC